MKFLFLNSNVFMSDHIGIPVAKAEIQRTLLIRSSILPKSVRRSSALTTSTKRIMTAAIMQHITVEKVGLAKR